MSYRLSRPAPRFDPALGLLRAEHFQMAYATTDLERAKALFRERLGITAYQSLSGPLAEGGEVRAELAWVGTLMYELVAASGPGSELYTSGLPADGGFHLRHHHLGYLLHDRAQWDAVLEQADANGWAVLRRSSNPLVDVCFVALPELGHLLEYLLPTAAGIAFIDGVPRS